MAIRPDIDEIRRSIAFFLSPGAAIELRVPKAGREGVISGYFSDPEKLLQAAVSVSGKAAGVYVTLNEIPLDLLARADNHVKSRADNTTADADVLRRRLLLLDFDPTRPAGISSTDEEHDAAIAAAVAARCTLSGLGWPEPLLADSGNGGHLLYAVALPNDADTLALIKSVLKAAALRFNGSGIGVDITVHNASRISKLYGTPACKGDSTANRPHRLSCVLTMPSEMACVPVELLKAFAAEVKEPEKPQPSSRGTQQYPPFDVEVWLADHNVPIFRGPVDDNGSDKWVLDACPFDPRHKAPDAAVFRAPSGALAFKCLHNTCADRKWQDFRDFYEPRRQKRQSPPPPSYDYRADASRAALGTVALGVMPEKPLQAIVSPERDDALSVAEAELVRVIESKDPALIVGDSLVKSLAAAGTLKQHEAKRRLKGVFKPVDFPIREWDDRIKAAEAELYKATAGSSDYILTSEGNVRAILANAITALAPLDLAFDTFQQRVVLRNPAPWGSVGAWTDDDDLHGTEHLQRNGILVENLRTTNGAARRIALKNQYHPVRDWLDSLVWDNVTRLDFWLNTYLGVPKSSLTLDFSRMWMISAVARIFEPGCKADCMLVLESGQGVKKSSALRMLVNGHMDAGREPFWFRDRIPTLSSDDVGLHMQGVWVIEIAELDAIRRSAAWTATKNFISDQSDTFRRKYGINLQDYPRQCVFAGSTNEKEWLGDTTGGRRFWAVPVSSVDLEGIKRDREQLWAEAVALYKAKVPWHLSDEQEAKAAEEIESRIPEDVWHQRVVAVVDALAASATFDENGESLSVSEVLDGMKIPTERQGLSEQNRIGRVLRSLNYSKYRAPADHKGRRQWRYRRSL